MLLPPCLVSLALLAQAAATPTAAPAAPATASSAPAPAAFGPFWDVLDGEWTGEGEGKPGAGSGSSTFEFDLEKRVLVRRSRADYPAAAGRPEVHHRDLLVISPARSPREGEAVYWDNEGHVIRYAASWTGDGKFLRFVSPKGEAGPRYRLVYEFRSPDTMTVTFGIAPAGSDEFKEYVGGVLKRTTHR